MKPETTMKVVPKSPTPAEIRGKKVHELCGNKVNQLVLDYLREASGDSFGRHHYFDKYNNEWKTFATIKNKQQRDVKVHLNAFELRVEYMMDLAAKQLADLKAEKVETVEGRADFSQ